MFLKRVTIVAAAIALLVSSPIGVFAQSVTPAQKGNQTQRIATLHTRCDNEVDKRITSLNIALGKINSAKKLSADQKTLFTNSITADSSGLTSLKAKCDADTDLATLLADTKSVFTTYRVYAVFLPQTHLIAAADTMDVTADKLNNLAGKLQTRIQQTGNPSTLTSLLADMQAKLKDAKIQYGNVSSQVSSLTPNSYNTDPNGTKTTLQNARNEIKTGSTDLKTASQDAKQIIAALKGMKTTIAPTQ